MVFESLVVDLINRFLGDFVENLDSSQLKIGIWGGDVVLQNLNLKESALDELDLPVKIKAGHIGKLVLKIPWKNLYTEPVIAELEGIYALAVPNIGIKYNAEKEEKARQDAKQKKLAQIEEAKKLEAQKGQLKEEKKDTFVEKLATQVIKNLQVRISSIHVRYEDRFTNPAQPISIGVTLGELLFQTTDENWTPGPIKEAVTQIYKLVKLDSLSVYWNSCSPMLSQEDQSVILDTLENNVASQKTRPDYQYIVRPISSVAHLRLNTKPQQKEFTVPKIGLTVVFDEIAVGLSKDQYDDILEMIDSVERMNRLSLYRKYRPDKPLKGNAALWWHYAYDSVLNETVRHRRQMWSWQHIAKHRKMMKDYREAYVTKLYGKKVSADVQKVLDDCETYLDVFSITVMRQQAEVKVAKLGARRKESTNGGWFGGWFGGRKPAEEEKKTGEIQEQFYQLYTPEEKAKLYSAIGYEENEMDMTYPKEYEAVKLVTKLRNVAISLRDGRLKEPQLLKLHLKDVYSYFGQRPAARAIHLDAKIDRMVVTGTPQDELAPRLISSQTQEGTEQIYSLANLSLDTNPLDGLCDTRVRLKTRPLEIIYDAVTVNKLAEFFKPPKSVQLQQFSQAAMSKFDEIREQSASSIQHAIEQHKYTDIGVDLMPSFIVVPEGGLMKNDSRKLILDLGRLTVVSTKHDATFDSKADLLEEKRSKAYDKFDISLQHIQVLLANPGDHWQMARTTSESPLHVLSPVDIFLDIQKCIFQKDPGMAKMKVSGVLPTINFNISDKRLKDIVALAQSIPLPQSDPQEEQEIFQGLSDLPTGLSTISTATLVNTAIKAAAEDVTKSEHGETSSAIRRSSSMEYANLVNMELSFEVKQLMIVISQQEDCIEVPVVKLVVESIGSDVQMRTFDMFVQTYLGSVHLQHLKFQLSNRVTEELQSVGAFSVGPLMNMVSTSSSVDPDRKLLTVKYLKANKDGPDFTTLYHNTEQAIHVKFSSMELLLHQGAILHLLAFAESLVPPRATSTSETPEEKNQKPEDTDTSSVDQKKEQQEKDEKASVKKSSKKKLPDPNLIDLKVTAVLSEFSVGICSDEKLITDIKIKGMEAEVLMQKAKTTVQALLKDLTISDPDKNTRYRQILRIEGSNVLKAGVVVYNGGTEGEKYADMSCVDTNVDVEIGCIKVVFLNKFVSDLLGFLDNFQNAKKQMQKAGQAAAQVGIEAVQSLQETAARLGLKVQMKAPVIVVPQNSISRNILLLDLGHLAITNSFLLAGQVSPNNVPAVLEQMNIVLTSFKLSRALMAEHEDTYAECLIVEPLTFSLQMRRNLSASWYHKSPDIELGGALEPLTVQLSQGDYRTLMQVLNENLSERQPQSSSTGTVQPSEVGAQTKAVSAKSDQGSEKASSSTVPEVYVRIRVGIQLKSLMAVFYVGDPVPRTGVCRREPSHALGKFELASVMASATIMSDSAIGAKISLKNMFLDDLRPSKATGITRMIERSKTASSHSSDMVCLNFQEDAKKGMNVKLAISRLYICVCMEFLMSLANIFTTQQAESSDSAVQPKEKDNKQLGSTPPASQETPRQPLKPMEILVEMENPEIILIEDQMNTSTNSLVVDMALSFRLLQTSEIQKLNAGISGLQIFSCTFNNRHKHGHQVLTPCDINVVSSAPHGRNHHIDISVGDIVLVISPSIISTMSAVSAGMTASQDEETTYIRQPAPADLWNVKTLASCNFWYLKSEKPKPGETALSQPTSGAIYTADLTRSEELVLNIPSVVLELEGGIGRRTVPLLILETNFWAQVRNWSSQLSVEASLDIEAGYYNERRAVWEPLLEPVAEDGKTRRWELGIEIHKNDDTLLGLDESIEDEEQEAVPMLPSKMVISVLSSDSLQLTVTKTSLEVLTNLSKAFNDAYNLVDAKDMNQEAQSPFLFVNNTGFEILLKLDPSFELPETAVQGRVRLQADALLPVYNKKEGSGATKASLIKATQEGDERKLIFQVEEFGATREVTIKRVEKRLFQINQRSHHGDVWSVVCFTDCKVGQKIFYLTSIVQVKNNLTVPVEVFYQGDTKLESTGVAQPNSVFSLPLKAVYSLSSELFFKPCVGSYAVSKEPFNWRSGENSGLKQISCPALAQGFSAFYFNIEPEVEKIYFEGGDQKTAKCFLYHLQPTIILHNLLPFSVKFLLQNTADQETLQKGENRPLVHASFTETNLEIVIPSYQQKEWVARCYIQNNMPELTAWSFETGSGATKVTLDLGLHCKRHKGTLDVSLFSPYWMINKTGRRLAYKGSDQSNIIEHTPDTGELLLFAYKEKSLFSTKKKDKEDGKPEGDKKSKDKVQVMKQAGKAQLQIDSLEWSDKFSLDTVGSSGTVQCKSKTETAEVGVKIHLSSSGLTKIVTFTPFYCLLNTSRETMMVSETGQDSWVEVPGRECVPFWPRQSEKITVKAKMLGTREETVPFLVNRAHTTLLKLSNDFGGINAECQVTESSMITTLKTYSPGLACVQVVNQTDNKDVTFYQSGLKDHRIIVGPQHAVLYTWNDAMGVREIYWTCGNKKDEKNDLQEDGMDEFFADSDTKVYWVAFLDGMQRVLLFTQDISVAAAAQEAGELEQMDQEIIMQIQSFGLSLVNDMTQEEVSFMGITSSGVIWEEKRRRRYKALKLKDCKLLEEAYQKYHIDQALGKTSNSTVLLENKMEVDLSKMMVVKPKSFAIRRSFENGIWVQYKASAHQRQLHAKINRLQFDNQMSHPIFPTVLSPLPPPKSVAADSVPKPFMEVSFMMRKHEHSNVHQIKYFKVLIQEMTVKLSQEFLNAILDFFAANHPLPRIQETIQFGEDIKQTDRTLMDVAGLSLSEEQKNFYDYLHLSPIKLHLSFSLQNSSGTTDSMELHAGVLNIFLQSVGVVLTDVQDVVFKLGYFERSHTFYNQSQLTGEMSRHYIGQAIKQMYVLVLGLDVLGNPFGLLRGLSEGIEDLFYEPYQGAIQGPEEFAEGLALGVRSLFGHTVGGAAGAVSRITGTLGKGLATLTLDEDYQKKRQAQLNQRPATAREGFARGGKGLVMGVFDGVTGIVRKPVEGARQEGVSGFFKGVGKGLVGVVTRPTSGVVDFASSSFEGIRRIAEMTDEVKRLRPPRRFFKDNVIRPYVHHEAEGYAILKETDKGKFIKTDEYQAHLVVSKDGKNVFILTDKHVIMAKLGDIFGSWDCEWAYTWAELKEPPNKTPKGFEIILKEKEKKKLFSSGASKKEVVIHDPRLVEWILPKIEEQMNKNK